MANKIDTGTGGFPIGDNKDLTTYDVGVVQDSPPLPAVPWSAGDIVAQGEQGSSDISKNTKKTLADYLSALTIKNVYHVDGAIVGNPLVKLVDEKGFPVSATAAQANPANKSHFTDSLQSSYTADLIAARAASTDPFKIKRGLASGVDPDGNTLLPTAAPGGILAAPIKTYTAEILKHNLNNQLDPLKKLDNVVIGDGGLVHADKIRPLAHTTTFSTDGGTSKNILHPDAAHNLSLKDSVDHLEADTGKGTSTFIGTGTSVFIGTGTGININYYPVSQDNETNLNLRTGGIPTPITATQNKSKFVDTMLGSPQETLRSVGHVEAYNLIKDDFHKGRSTTKLREDGKDRNGNTILDVSPIQSPVDISKGRSKGNIDPDHPVAKYSTALLNSRFNIDHQYENMSIADTNSTFYAQQFAQKYPLGRSLAENEPRNITFGKLAQLGPALSLRSGLEMTDLANPTGAISEAEALLPGINQTGIERIERSRLEAGNVLTELINGGLEDANPDIVLINPAALSYGSLNNIFDQFSGISNFGMQVLAIALILALSIIMVAVFGLFTIMSKNRSINTDVDSKHGYMPGYDGIGRRTIGSYLGSGSSNDMGSVVGIIRAITAGDFNFWQVIGIQPTRNELQDCAVAGALAFFGIDFTNDLTGKPSAAASILNSLAAGAQNPGYDSIMARSISRSFLSIGDALVGFKGTTVTGGIKKTLGLIAVLRDSKFMRALNVFSQLGDQVLSGAYDTFVDTTATGGFGKKISKMDAGEIDHKLAVQRNNRLKGSLTLAWATSRAPDSFIYPAGYAAAIAYKVDEAPATLPRPTNNRDADFFYSIDKKSTATSTPGSSRISTEFREAFETKLDAEYMPFYFHDVRTNEFVSFHAFLASLTDAYTATYDAVDAFGRVEQIKTYKGTARKIGFSFYIAATSEPDFQIMWSKINKLSTLVYPQFTEGKEVFSDDGKYRLSMPFSQQIGAAPMVRIRIGDLVQSNYSKFNLARLFGATYPNNTIDESKLGADASSSTGSFNSKKFESDINAAIEDRKGQPGYFYNWSGPNTDLSFGIENVKPVPYTKTNDLKEGIVFSGLVVDGNATTALMFPSLNSNSTNETTRNFLVPLNSHKAYIPLGTNKNFFIPTDETRKKIINEVMKKFPDGKYFANLNEFMDDRKEAKKGNIIAKSFRSSGGRGLGGFIDTMSFDWFDKVTWAGLGTSAPTGLRAPKICKVTIAFSPIHDITPGLDHLGSNRAPIYPVGYLSPFRSPVPPRD